ncbi:MAG: ABC transporter ATP-binding protein [Actinomycetes bacterium]
MMHTLDVQDLTVVRGGKLILPGLTCTVQPGLVTGLLGPSGGGKTTLMRAIVGVQRISSGSVSVLGLPAGAPELRHRIGYVTQSPSVYEDLTLRENLAYFAAVLDAPAADVDRVASEVDLAALLDTVIRTFSGGERARASLATALLGSPELLVLDEPTVGLDPVLRRSLWVLFRDLASRGVTVLVSSHVMDEADRCDRLLLLRSGRILADGTRAEILAATGTSDIESAFLALVQEEPS